MLTYYRTLQQALPWKSKSGRSQHIGAWKGGGGCVFTGRTTRDGKGDNFQRFRASKIC